MSNKPLLSKKRFVAEYFQEETDNMWVVFNALSKGRDVINLGMGFPDFASPDFLLVALGRVARDPSSHSISPSRGHPSLIQAICQLYSPVLRHDIEENEVISNFGADGILYIALRALIKPGDEVILLEPAFESYASLIELCGAIPVFVPFTPPHNTTGPSSTDEWRLDPTRLESAVSSSTSLLLLNNPNNPLGKSMSKEEIKIVADLCKRHNLLLLSDEVYEWMTYEGRELVRVAAVEGMWKRTVSVFSAGKMFSVTGWKLGWAVGPADLISRMEEVLKETAYCGCTPLQLAVGEGVKRVAGFMGTSEGYLCELRRDLERKRDTLFTALVEIGLSPIKPSGTYFMMMRIPRLMAILATADTSTESYDFTFVKWMIREVGLAVIPVTPFCGKQNTVIGDTLVRLCFAKKDSTLAAAIVKLKLMKEKLDKLS
ncbi:tyrosine aminotransferase [Oopsacas minuta]|uniref:Tyrosine aminotransferase n=1 Tax=Oopsacas minuta TaxID=111878 RepID=A0AAV7KGJ7_9METZ|nr:tyrosine aminotransferase [Oopsacas minuta]